MKFEDLIAKCPKCGSTDKTAHRRFIDNQEKSEEETIKKDLIGELNKKL